MATGVIAASLLVAACGRRADVGPVVVSAIGETPQLAGARRDGLGLPDRLLTDSLAEGLVRFDAAGQIEPGVAERWIVTDNGRSYIFRLREATWSDGSPVRAAQIVALLKRQLARSSRNPLLPYLSAIDTVVEMTPQVIEVSLSRPRPDLLKLFAQPDLALVRGIDAGVARGAGPFRVAPGRGGATLLTPAVDPDGNAQEAEVTPEQNVRLIAERAALAVVRFTTRRSDLVLGGDLGNWPMVQAAAPSPANVRIDPAAGLFGLAIVRREGFLDDPANCAALAAAIDREALAAAVSREWTPRTAILPEQLDSLAPPVQPAWAAQPRAEQLAAARARVAAWRAGRPSPVVTVALPVSHGASLLWSRIAVDLAAIGVDARRLPPDAPDADMMLVDKVAPYDSARWYLAEACVRCSAEAASLLETARLAADPAERARAIALADRAMANDAAFIPIARPFRWSLVALRLRQWQPNVRAWHPLNRLREDPN